MSELHLPPAQDYSRQESLLRINDARRSLASGPPERNPFPPTGADSSLKADAARALLRRKKLFLFDLDGVFYKGKESRVKLGGSEAIDAIRRKGKGLLVLTNNSTDSVETVHRRLLQTDIPVSRGEILTSSYLTADHLSRNHGKVSYFLVGERGLDVEMKKRGHHRSKGEDADFVVVGLDRGLTYEKLDHAARVVRRGAEIIATHSARLYMQSQGPAMAAGPIVKALEYATGKTATVIGKPSPLMFRMALDLAGCKEVDAVMVGDQVETDLIGAKAAGIDAILITTGVDSDPQGVPVIATLSNVDDLVQLL